MKQSEEPIIVEEKFNTSQEKLWSVITELNQMKQWYFEEIETFEPKVGFETKFVVENKGRKFPHLWRIAEVEKG